MEKNSMETHTPNTQRLKAMVLNGNGHAFDAKTGRSFSINPTAQVALLMMQDGKSRKDVIETLCALCAQPAAIVEPGVEHFLEQMTRYVS
jgi:hypothetical protein